MGLSESVKKWNEEAANSLQSLKDSMGPVRIARFEVTEWMDLYVMCQEEPVGRIPIEAVALYRDSVSGELRRAVLTKIDEGWEAIPEEEV